LARISDEESHEGEQMGEEETTRNQMDCLGETDTDKSPFPGDVLKRGKGGEP